MPSSLTRRSFLAGAGTGLLIVPARTAFTYQANERLNLAVVGTFGYCAGAFFFPKLHTLDNVAITTVCDVDDRKLARK